MKNDFELLKTTTIKEFRTKFFKDFEKNEELVKEFSKFTNSNNSMVYYDEFIKNMIKVLKQTIYNEQKIGKNIGNLNVLKVRLKQSEINLKKFLEETKKKQKKAEFTEIGFVEWFSVVGKYYGFEIKSETSIFDFLVMSKKMNKDIEKRQQEVNKFKTRKNGRGN